MAGGVKYVSLLERSSGYATAARRYLTALRPAAIPLSWTPMVPGRGWGLGYEPYRGRSIEAPGLADLCNRPVDYDTVLVHTVPEYFPMWRAEEPGKRLIGYTTWETDRPPDHWPPLLNAMDLLLVPCRWNRDVFRAHGVTTPIEVVPHIAHPGPFPDTPPRPELVFYTIGGWTVRKAVGNVIEAFCRSFRSADPVRLVVKTSERDFTRRNVLGFVPGARGAARRVLRRHRDPPAIEIVARDVSDAEIDSLHASGDCFVWLGHGEGWLIPAFDAAAFGNAVVAPRFGGPLDYLSEASSYLVDCALGVVDDPRAPESYASSQRWAIPDLDDAARVMRRVHEHRAEARERGAALASSVRERFGEDVVRGTLLSILRGDAGAASAT